MKRKIRILLIVCALILLATAVVYADTDSGSYDTLYDNYNLDMESKSMLKAPVANIFNALANGIFGLVKMLGDFICSLTDFAYSINMFDLLSDTMTPIFGNIGTKIFNSLSLIFIGIAGLFLIIKLARGQLINIVIGIASLVLVIAISTAFLTYPGKILSELDSAFSDVAGEIIDPIYEDINGSDASDVSSSEKTANLLWNIMVHKPWQILEFGDESTAEKYEDKILSLDDGSDEREEFVKSLEDVDEFKATTSQQVKRFSAALIYFVFSLVIFVAVLFFLVLIVGYQLWVWILAILAVFVFIMALIPDLGLGVIKRWGIQVLSAMAIKVILSFLLIVLFVIMSFFYGLSGEFTLFEIMFMFISMFFIAYKKRGDFAKIFAISGSVPGMEFVNRERMYNSVGNGAKDVKRRVSNKMISRMYGSADSTSYDQEYDYQNYSYDNVNRNRQYSSYHDNSNNIHVNSNREQNRQNSQDDVHVKQRGKDDLIRESNSAADTGLYSQEDKDKAIVLLRQNFENSKKLSEENAQKSGRPVEYTEFVRRTEALRAMNKNAEFDSRDVERTARIVHNCEAAGGNIDMLKTNIHAESETSTVKRPQNLSDYKSKINSDPSTLKSDIAGKQAETKKGLSFFKSNFGEENGEKYYNRLAEKYGEEHVRKFTSDDKLTYSQVNRKLRGK